MCSKHTYVGKTLACTLVCSEVNKTFSFYLKDQNIFVLKFTYKNIFVKSISVFQVPWVVTQRVHAWYHDRSSPHHSRAFDSICSLSFSSSSLADIVSPSHPSPPPLPSLFLPGVGWGGTEECGWGGEAGSWQWPWMETTMAPSLASLYWEKWEM